LWAFATLSLEFPEFNDSAARLLGAHSQACSAQDAANALWAMSRLRTDSAAVTPLALAVTTQHSTLAGWTAALYSLAVLENFPPDVFRSGWEALGTGEAMNFEQLHSISVVLRICDYKMPSVIQCSSALRDRAMQAANTARQGKMTGTNEHANVLEILQSLGIRCEAEGGSSEVDADVYLPDHKVAVEVDGEHHFTHLLNPNGRTHARNLILESQGLKVVIIPYFEWQRLSIQDRKRYLASKLASAGVPV